MTDNHFSQIPKTSTLWFVALVAGFYLNDLLFIGLNGAQIYYADYIVRIMIIVLCLSTAASRTIALSRLSDKRLPIVIVAMLIPPLIVLARLPHIYLEPLVVEAVGQSALFHFGRIENTLLYVFDLTVGLALVSISEELVFRKYALHWLRGAGMGAVRCVLISATIFGFMHWGSGLHRVASTFVFGLISMTFYIRYTGLWPLFIVHYVSNFIAFVELD